jgi:hypothetical protein
MAELKYDMIPRNAPRFAADVVATTEKIDGAVLDYSVESLETVDRIIGGFREEGVTVEDVAATLFGFGCYVGEVFARNAGATWQAASQDEINNVFGVPLVLQLGKATVNPIGKVVKRLEEGDEHDLPSFYRKFTRRLLIPYPAEISREAEQDYDVLFERMMPLVEEWMQEDNGFIPCGSAIAMDGRVVGHPAKIVGEAATEESFIRFLLAGLRKRARAGEIRASCVCWDGQFKEGDRSMPAIVTILEHIRGPALILHRPYRKNPEGTYEYVQAQVGRIRPEVFTES